VLAVVSAAFAISAWSARSAADDVTNSLRRGDPASTAAADPGHQRHRAPDQPARAQRRHRGGPAAGCGRRRVGQGSGLGDARATEDISARIAAIQDDTTGAATSIERIAEVIGRTKALLLDHLGRRGAERHDVGPDARTITGVAACSTTGEQRRREPGRRRGRRAGHCGDRAGVGDAAGSLARVTEDLQGLVGRFAADAAGPPGVDAFRC
jgi:hypothetical protein